MIPTPPKPDLAMAARLGDGLAKIAQLKGSADIEGILPHYEQWYGAARSRFLSQANAALAMAYFNRHRAHILKLAVINEAAFSNSLKVSHGSWERAAETASQLEATIFDLLSTGMSASGHTLGLKTEKVEHTGVEGLSLSGFTRAFQDIPRQTREDMVSTLVDAGTVRIFATITKGRPARHLVHENFLAEYKKAHPLDCQLNSIRDKK